jgi:hypothetical protein
LDPVADENHPPPGRSETNGCPDPVRRANETGFLNCQPVSILRREKRSCRSSNDSFLTRNDRFFSRNGSFFFRDAVFFCKNDAFLFPNDALPPKNESFMLWNESFLLGNDSFLFLNDSFGAQRQSAFPVKMASRFNPMFHVYLIACQLAAAPLGIRAAPQRGPIRAKILASYRISRLQSLGYPRFPRVRRATRRTASGTGALPGHIKKFAEIGAIRGQTAFAVSVRRFFLADQRWTR